MMCFFQTLDQSELQGDGVALSLEEQLCALSLSEPSDSDPKDTVSLNGSRFSSELFQDTRESTKVSILCRTMLCLMFLQCMAMFKYAICGDVIYFRFQLF